jgi:dipeptidyl aminopeptidase/acylaminoacyl peptidase
MRWLCLSAALAALSLSCSGLGWMPQPDPSATPNRRPLATLTSTPSPSPSATLPPTATLHPLTIESMRLRDYPGSEVTREQELEPGINYDRFRASYYSEGLKIYALLTIPRGQPPAEGWPVIVFNHGYIPPDEYRTTERYVAYVDNLARHGYLVFRPDYRGHDQSEGLASGAYGSPDYVVDVLNAVAAMRRFPGADPNRIGMWGHSMGGYITLRSMVIDPQIRAGVIWAGVVGSYPDLMYRWRRTPTPGPDGTPFPERGWRGGLASIYGSPEENPAFWASISANSFLADLSGPVQLHHGTADSSVPHLFSELLAGEIEQAGGAVELYLYPGADHNLSQPFSLAMQRTINFFDEHLKG